jgi:hypothetical protein
MSVSHRTTRVFGLELQQMLPRISPFLYLSARSLTTARRLPSTAYTEPSSCAEYEPATQTTPADLTESQRGILEGALRIDQAGEIAANYIYQGQMAVLGHDKRLRALIQVHFLALYVRPPLNHSSAGYVGARKETSCCHG